MKKFILSAIIFTGIGILKLNAQLCLNTCTNYTTGTLPVAVCSADLNADGKADLAVANGSSNTIPVLYGNGQGGSGTATSLHQPASYQVR